MLTSCFSPQTFLLCEFVPQRLARAYAPLQYNTGWQNLVLCSLLPPFPGVSSSLNVNKMAALSKGTFLIPETGNEARHLYICFQMNWFLCCKYLTILHSVPTKVSIRFSANSISHRQITLLLLSRTLFKQIEIIFHGVWFEKEQKVRCERHIFPLVEARRPWAAESASKG